MQGSQAEGSQAVWGRRGVALRRGRVRGRVRGLGLSLVLALAAGGARGAVAPSRPAQAASAAARAAATSRWESPQAMQDVAKDYVREHLPAGAGADHVRISIGLVAARFPRCAPQHLTALPFGNPNPYGAQTVQLHCDAPQRWSVYLQADVDWPQQVVVAAHAIAPGHTLVAGDLQLLQRDRAALPPGAVQDESQVEGRVLRLGIAAGQSITESMLAGPRLIHYGQAVSLIAEGDGVRLEALGIALQDGSQGQTVLVRNAQSGKVVSGVVDARGDVVAALLH